jgi:hypothetical protein
VNQVEAAGREAVVDRPPTGAELDQLPPRNNSVLA